MATTLICIRLIGLVRINKGVRDAGRDIHFSPVCLFSAI